MQKLERQHTPPSQPLPGGAADCHLHAIGPFDRFPLAAARAYNVPEAPAAAHERMKRRVGLERSVFVQASGHGTDNRAMLAALAEIGARSRGVAVVEPDAPPRELDRLREAGVCGIRLNFMTLRERYAGAAAGWVGIFEKLLLPFRMHLQIFSDGPTLAGLENVLARTKIGIVIDHMGMPDAALGVGQPGFQALLRLLRTGRVWAKLAGADRITRGTGRLRDALPFMRALAEAGPQRLVWGSDWPNIGFHAGKQVTGREILPHRELDAGKLLDLLIEAVPDAAERRAILVTNAEKLYGFEPWATS